MAKMLVGIADGRIVPWYSVEDPVPAGYVVVPESLLAKHRSGEIADGKALAKAALAANAEIGVAPQNVAVPPPPKATTDPSTVDPATIERGEPTEQEIVTATTRRGTMRA